MMCTTCFNCKIVLLLSINYFGVIISKLEILEFKVSFLESYYFNIFHIIFEFYEIILVQLKENYHHKIHNNMLQCVFTNITLRRMNEMEEC
jgi:hypothetical protein